MGFLPKVHERDGRLDSIERRHEAHMIAGAIGAKLRRLSSATSRNAFISTRSAGPLGANMEGMAGGSFIGEAFGLRGGGWTDGVLGGKPVRRAQSGT